MSTSDANQSLYLTKVRLVVELVNGNLIRSFKALRDVPNKSLPYTLVYYKIAAALINKYFHHLILDNHDGKEIVINMKNRFAKENLLKKTIKQLQLKLKSKFTKLDGAHLNDFGTLLSLKHIKTHLTLGSYQLQDGNRLSRRTFSKQRKIRDNG